MIEQHTLKILEWERLLKILSSYAISELGKAACLNLKSSNNMEYLEILHSQTDEALRIINTDGEFPLTSVKDVDESLTEADKGRCLTAPKLLDISDNIKQGKTLRKFLVHKSETSRHLWEIVSKIEDFKDLASEIDSCFAKDGTMLDTASAELSRIRNKIRTLQNNIRIKLNKFVQNPEYKNLIHEELVTQRNDRYVIYLKTGGQSQISGIIHDQSSSGLTLYFEPMFIVGDNNELRETFIEEQKEMERILSDLTDRVRESIPDLYVLVNILARMDCIIAKARYSLSIKGTKPVLNNNGIIKMKRVRHPLLIKQLEYKNVIPIDIEIGENFNTLIITGPNTGGKTVSLKTLGIIALMIKIGLQIPASEDSIVGNFDNILADIGDEQSIEQNLSTFSGHMSNIASILQKATPKSLVIIDEIGTGTDPEEGVALAEAILEELHTRNCKTVVTTHFGELKAMAYQKEGIQNAAVEFDIDTLQPTYNLLMGVPGRSNAIFIASRLGMPQYIFKRAKELMNKETHDINLIIDKMEEQRKKLKDETEKVTTELKKIEKMEEELKIEQEVLDEDRRRFMAKSRKELADDIKDAKEVVAQIIRDLQQGVPTGKDATEATKRITKIEKKHLKEAAREQQKKNINRAAFKIGVKVFYPHLTLMGELISNVDDNDNVQVSFGNFTMSINITELEIKSGRDKNNQTRVKVNYTTSGSSNECDLRGMLAVDALEETEKFLEAQSRTTLHNVYIIHGEGTGALRKAIRSYLSKSPYSKAFRPGEKYEGGNGVTVVELNN